MEIRKHEDIIFGHVQSKDNAADIGSRGTSISFLMNYEQWWHGPKWLDQSESEWPISNGIQEQTSEAFCIELKDSCHRKKLIECELVVIDKSNDPPCDIQIEHFSSVTKLLRVTALVLKFIRKLKERNVNSDSESSSLTSDEIEHAENMWVTHIQQKHYSDIVYAIEKDKPNNMKQQLGLYIDDLGMIRCHGRIDNSDLCEGAKHPLLLPKCDQFTRLIIERSHKQIMHAGVSQTLNRIREKYWITHGRSSVKRVLKDCGVCRRHEGGPFKMPNMPQLPKRRVTQATPFTYTGLDYLGPLFVKSSSGTQKVWICLFTCMITRAIHLELLQDMSAEQFLMAMRRFIARRGTPTEILSDNAAQFKLSSCVIDQLWGAIIDSENVKSYVANSAIKWNFIVERAPWMGGTYERLVGLVKRCLRKSIGKNCLTNEQMLTYVSEAEAVVNSRPIVYIDDDINSSVTLTPAHFLTLNPKIGIPECENSDDQDFDPYDSSAKTLLKSWKKGQKLLNQFWQLWKKEYLLSLRERYQTKLGARRVQSIYSPSIGDIVLIHDDLPRGTWRMGKINELNTSFDGQIRSAKVLVSNGKIMGRPLNLLYPIECPVSAKTNINEDNNCDVVNKTDTRMEVEQTNEREQSARTMSKAAQEQRN